MPTVTTCKRWLTLTALLTATLLLTACGEPEPLIVHPAEPIAPPKVAVPKVLSDPVKRPSWLQ